MNRPLNDAAARRRIRGDTSRTLFVEAGAGSGKTTSLVDRVVSVVLDDGVPLRNVAAVTFTDKAAAELRDRLRGMFEARATDPEASGEVRKLATVALDDIDSAAVGTLHAFARRILTAHPIEAGLPPLIEVLDEVGSQVAFEERWIALRADLLNDDGIRTTLLTAFEEDVTLEHLRSLAVTFDSEWDRLDAAVLAPGIPQEPIPQTSELLQQLDAVCELTGHCVDDDDKLLAKLGVLDEFRQQLEQAEPIELLSIVREITSVKVGSIGQAPNWPTLHLGSFRKDITGVCATAKALHNAATDQVLRRLAYRIAGSTIEGARARQREGRLEFHDLLVLSRDMLRNPLHGPAVRAQLHHQYQRILLDEFQDTDPIQIELAVRIAADSGEAEWQDMIVPPGRLFVVGDPKQSIYRFRRADIATYLCAQSLIGQNLTLTSNFRSTPKVLAWVNHVFSRLIVPEPDSQPEYNALGFVRDNQPDELGGVTVLGTEAHPDNWKADDVRTAEAQDVAASITTALAQGWLVGDEIPGSWRRVQLTDIAVLIPARTSLPHLETALEQAGIPYQADASSLVYQTPEVRDLLMAARAINDPSDELALVTCLRSAMFGCGDDDLWTWKRERGSFNLLALAPDTVPENHPVRQAVAYLRELHDQALWLAPSEVLDRLVRDRRMMELGLVSNRPRDIWRRLRFVIDQARAWSDTEHGGLRAYLGWANRQGDESARVSEAVLPETDTQAVRIMTIHSAKGLEFPVVIVSGMSSRPGYARGVEVLWPRAGGYQVKLSKGMHTGDFEAAKPVDEQMDFHERIRLLYVASTRAKDHLVVSLHRAARKNQAATDRSKTNAELLAEASVGSDAHELLPVPSAVSGVISQVPPEPSSYEQWLKRIQQARRSADRPSAISASSLENLPPKQWETAIDLDLALSAPDGLIKDQRDLELPPWNKGRYGNAIGRAVHGSLQTVDLAGGAGLEEAVAAQSLAEGVLPEQQTVLELCRSALSSDLIKRIATRPHWREMYVGTQLEDGRILEGFIDLLCREDDGSLVVVDYKTDAVPDAAIDARARVYLPQMAAYCAAVERATGETVSHAELLFLRPGAATHRRVTSTNWPGSITTILEPR